MNTTVGQLLLDDVLPADMRGVPRVLDKKGIQVLMEELADKHPESFRKVNHALWKLGMDAAQSKGSSFSIKDLRAPPEFQAEAEKLRIAIQDIVEDPTLTSQVKERELRDLVTSATPELEELLYTSALRAKNPFALQVLSGSRGNKSQLRSLLGGDFLVADHRDRVIPMPIMNSYSQGVDPAEYWAGAYGARKGTICLVGGTAVLMGDWTTKPIQEIRPGDIVMGADRSGHCYPTGVVRLYNNGKQPCYRYLFRKNSCRSYVALESTETHKVLAQIRRGSPGALYGHLSVLEAQPLPLSRASFFTNANKNTFSAMPCEGQYGVSGTEVPLAFLLGVMLGDGCMAISTRGRYTLSCADPSLIQGVELPSGVVLKKAKGSNYNWYFDGEAKKELYAELRRWLGECLAHEKMLPSVAAWSTSALCQLLGGLYSTDGSIGVRKGGVSVRLQLTSESLVREVQRLLELRLGIWTSEISRVAKETKPHATHDQYGFTIAHARAVARFFELIPLRGKKARQAAEVLPRLSKYHNALQYGFKIQSREYLGEQQTWDIEVETPEHLFVLANGLIVSNSTKFATMDAGFFGKQLMQAAHRMVVTEDDCGTTRGIMVAGDDPDNVGALLARKTGGYDAGDIVTPKMVKGFADESVMVRSPITCQARHGVCARCTGVRESGSFPSIGDNVGVTASTSLTERLSQAQLNVKHTGGLAKGGKKGIAGGDPSKEIDEEDTGENKPELTGFKLINQLAQVPTAFKGGAAVAQADGSIDDVVVEPQGGHSVVIRGVKHYVPEEFKVLVKPGQVVEAGDILSEGVPNPAEIVRHRGVGAGRRAFVDIFRDAFKKSGMNVNRRNIELVARGLVNHVRMTDLDGPDGALPDDIMEYDILERDYQPRHGFLDVPPHKAIGMYLERPELHYSIGTRVTKSVADALEKAKVPQVYAHGDTPSFEPEMVPVMRQLSKTPNWQTRLGGSFLQTGLTEAVHRSRKSDLSDTSFIPGLARGADFGRQLTTKGVY